MFSESKYTIKKKQLYKNSYSTNLRTRETTGVC